MKNLCKNIFSVSSYFEGIKKHKIIKIFGIKFKFKVQIVKNPYYFVKTGKPLLLKQFGNISEQKRSRVYLSILAIFKDEPDIIEWIEYHMIAGVERFYLYDNNSKKDYFAILKPYINKGIVVYKKVIGECMQRPVYCDAVKRYKNETEWMAIIDLDEYIVPVEKDDIKAFLKDYEKYPAVVVNWVMFDSNKLEKRPIGKTVVESFTSVHKNYQHPINKTVKTILHPSKIKYVRSVHTCIYNNNELAVDENFKKFRGKVYFQTEKVSVDKIRINHYYCKSKEEYLAKINKGFADRKSSRIYDESKLNFPQTTNDTVILKFSDRLNEKLNNFDCTIV